jgi:Leucine-rich repeat (LRR) protein
VQQAQLVELPEGLISVKEEVRELKVHSTALRSLPTWIEELVSLEKLELKGQGEYDRVVRNNKIQSLPASLGNLHSLVELELSCLEALEALPEAVGDLTSLQKLNISVCSRLRSCLHDSAIWRR